MRKDGQFDESWSAEDRSKFEAEISRFESAWQSSGPPDLAEFLPAAGDFRDRLWDELVAIDQEYRHQRGMPTDPASYEQLKSASGAMRGLEQQSAGDSPRHPPAKLSSADTSLPGYTVTYRPGADGELHSTRESTWTAGDSAPRRFGRFEIQKELGAGAMGAVYLAFDTRLQRSVALKFPKFSQDNEPGLLERFYREARSAATLRHPNICPVYDADCIDGVHFIAMAYIQGRLLSQFVDRRALPSTRNAALVVRKIALAVHEAHEQGVVHRDLKPSNIMIDDRNEPIVMDFGLARISASPVTDDAGASQVASQADYGQTQFGDIIGTPRYMSPEQARGDVDQLGPASDIFSLGVIFYELLTGQAPFSASGLRELLAEIVSTDPVPSTKLRPDIPVELERICLTMLSKKPADRPATMKKVAEHIRDALKGSPSGIALAKDSVSTIQPSVRPSEKRRSPSNRRASRIALIAGLVCLSIGAAIAYLYWQSRPGLQTAEFDKGPGGNKAKAIKHDGDIEATVDNRNAVLPRVELATDRGRIVLELLEDEAPDLVAIFITQVEKGVYANVAFNSVNESWLNWSRAFGKGYEGPRYRVATGKDGGYPRLGDVLLVGPDYGTGFSILRNGPIKKHTPLLTFARIVEGMDIVGKVQQGDKFSARVLSKRAHGYKPPPLAQPAVVDLAAKPIEKPATGVSELAPEKTYQLPDGCICLSLSPDNRRIAIGNEDRKAYLYDLELGKIVRTFGPHSTRVLSVDFSPDGTKLATGEDSKEMHVWNVESGEKLHTFSAVNSSWGIRFSPDGKHLAGAGGKDLWNLANHGSDMRLEGRNQFGTSVAFVPGSNELAAVEYLDGAVMLIDLATGKIKRQIATLGKGTRCVSVSPDGTRLAVAHGDGPEHAGPQAVQGFAVHVFERATGKTLARFDGQRGVPWSVAFDPQRKWLACASFDGVIRLWHADSLRPGPTLSPLPKLDLRGGYKVRNVIFTSEGDHLIAVSIDGTACMWNLPKETPPAAIAPFSAEEAKQHQQAWARHLGVPVEYTNSAGMKFVLIPPGEFTMGSTPAEIEEALKIAGEDKHWQDCIKTEAPQHKVILTRPIYLGVHEVTQGQYQKVMGKNPSHFAALGAAKHAVVGMETASHPVEGVSWNDAAEFCAKLSEQEKLKPFYLRSGETVTPLDGTGYRLPTEAEWEFACRAGTTTKYWIGGKDEDLPPAGWFDKNSGRRTHPVGELRVNPLGLYDIHGNVWEWVQDGWEPTYYGQFQGKSVLNPNGPASAGSQRVIRGGSWLRSAPDCRATSRYGFNPTFRNYDIGFRVAIAVDAAKVVVAKPKRPEAASTPGPRVDPELGRVPAAGARALTDWELIYVDGRDKVMVATADGSSPRPLADPPGKVKSLSSLADASVVFECCDRQIVATSASGIEPWETVHEFSAEPREAFVSPDGKRVAWLKARANAFELIVESLDGSELQNLGYGYDPHWFGGGSELLYLKWIGKWIVSRWDGNLSHNTIAPLHAQLHVYPAPSPDGSYYAFSMDAAEGRAREIGFISRDGKRLRQLTETGKLNSQASFSPDGRYVAFLRTADVSTELSVVDTDTRWTQEVLRGVKYVRPVWRAKRPSTDSPGKSTKRYEKPRPLTTNLAYQKPGEEFPKASASFTSSADKVERANDGKVDYRKTEFQRWTSYQSLSDRDWLQIEFAQEAEFSQVELAIYHEPGGGVQAPARYEAEYWEGDAWRPVSNPKYVPEQPQGNTRNTVTFDKVKSKKVRVVFTHRKDARSGISEIAVWP